MKTNSSIGITIVVVLLIASVPLFFDAEKSFFVYYLFLAFINIALAQGWNFVAGYAGQISLGQHAFFGLGAYTTAIIWTNNLIGTKYYFDPFTMFFSGLLPAIFAVIVGIPLLNKLRGNYFALGTLGLGEILRVILIKGGHLTGGPAGLTLDSTLYKSILPYYWTSLFIALLATATAIAITRSRIGLALVSIREDETAAAASGIYVSKYKILAFALGAFFTGLCGSMHAYYLFIVNPSGFLTLKWALYPILMCVIGGSGTVIGPVIGAFFLTGVFSWMNAWFPELSSILSGALIIIVMLFMPNGIIGFAELSKQVLKRRMKRNPYET